MEYRYYRVKDEELALIVGVYNNGFLFLPRATDLGKYNVFASVEEIEIVVGKRLQYLKTFSEDFTEKLNAALGFNIID